MPTVTIDCRSVHVPPGTTILAAARQLGIDVPTLCYFEGFRPSTSCLVCMVKIKGTGRLVPSCATEALDGMEIESETAEVHQVRRSALELLLSDHLGDCLAPCHFACPAHMDIPGMLRQITAENLREAIVTVKRDIALPAILGRICPKPCEKGCRRSAADGAVAVCGLKRFVADVDLASGKPYLPECKPLSGKRVAIVGAGPAGLAAAWHLRQAGHACTMFDDQPRPGGRLWRETNEQDLPRDVLEGEIGLILRLGVDLRPATTVGVSPSLGDLQKDFDAVLVACGAIGKEAIGRLGLKAAARGVEVHRATFETGLPGVFAAGNALRGKGLVVRSVADGKEAAMAIDQYLSGRPVTGPEGRFSTRIGRLEEDEVAELVAAAVQVPRREPDPGAADFDPEEAAQQAGRCLHCDCRALADCKLRRYAAQYGADPNRYRGQRARLRQDHQHSEVIYEPGKCINCELCIQIATAAGEPLGLSFVGRGFDVRVGVPFDRSMAEALSKVAAECVAACPTAALSFKDHKLRSELPIL
jgi:ferredoxin